MQQMMEAEILFLDPDDVEPANAVLVEHGFAVEVLNWVDPYGPTMWIKARIATELDDDRFFDWVDSIVTPLRGDVVEAGFLNPPGLS